MLVQHHATRQPAELVAPLSSLSVLGQWYVSVGVNSPVALTVGEAVVASTN